MVTRQTRHGKAFGGALRPPQKEVHFGSDEAPS
jgi:hypothetical protein